MPIPDTAEVLIVGAGPTGLVLALALQKNGCPNVVVVDGALQGENTSRAVAVHAATVEALDTLGVADLLVKAGTPLNRTSVWMNGIAPMDIAYFPPLFKNTKYNYILGIAQHITEKVLRDVAEERGITVHRPYKVIDLKPNASDPNFTDVIFEDGHVIRARAVVGADGARSTVRALAGISWNDPAGEAEATKDAFSNMIIADVTLNSAPLYPDAINLVVSDDNALLLIWLPGQPYPDDTSEPVYRISCGIPPSMGAPPSKPDTAYVQDLLDKWGPNTALPKDAPRLEIKRTVWSSRFRTHSSISERFFTHVPIPGENKGTTEGGPIFLLGDAAHIHPPMGGQGMNLGIRDGVRLAPLLSEYIRSASSGTFTNNRKELEAPLQNWAADRREKALKVIGMVKDLQSLLWLPNKQKRLLGIIPYNPAQLRNTMLRIMTSFDWFKAKSAYRVSGLGNP